MEVGFHGHETKYFVTPLTKIEDGEYEEEIKSEDNVILAGQYLIVVERNGVTFTPNELPNPGHQSGKPKDGPLGPSPPALARNGHINERYPVMERRSVPGPPPRKTPRPQMQLETVLNWLKVTGVETPRRRRRHPQIDATQMIISAIR